MEIYLTLESEIIDKARALLHDCYVKILSWNIIKDNPSGLRISQSNGYEIIADDYDLLSVWFTAIHMQKTTACARICKRDANGLLEIERYPNGKKIISPILKAKNYKNIIELNREAVLPTDENKLVCLLLLRKIFSYCFVNNYSILTTTNLPEWVAIYEYISFPKLEEENFKYFESDPSPVNIYLAEKHDISKMIKKIDFSLRGKNHKDVIIKLSNYFQDNK